MMINIMIRKQSDQMQMKICVMIAIIMKKITRMITKIHTGAMNQEAISMAGKRAAMADTQENSQWQHSLLNCYIR